VGAKLVSRALTPPTGSNQQVTIPSLVTITGLKQNGTLALTDNTGSVDLDSSQVDGLTYVENNTATIIATGNAVNGFPYCTGNSTDPADNGTINTVVGIVTDQCTAIARAVTSRG
jgi:hypothetical protein